MSDHQEWLSGELSRWTREGLIHPSEAEAIWERYKRRPMGLSWTVPLFAAASSSLLLGLAFIGAEFWSEFSQDERFSLALVPLVVSLLLAAMVLLADGKKENAREAAEEILRDSRGGNEVEMPAPLPPETIAVIPPAEKAAPAAKKPVREERVPLFIREGVGLFHGLAVTASLWMVHDSFMLNGDLYPLFAFAALASLFMTYVLRSAGLGLLFSANTAVMVWLAPDGGWPDAAAWLLLAAALPFFFVLVKGKRERGGIAFAWGWMAAVLAATFCTASDEVWQVLFFSVAASLTWLVGTALRSYGWIGSAFRVFGGAAVFGVLLAGSMGRTWQAASGSIFLWGLLLVFLLADGAVLFRIAQKKEWLGVLAGLTPFAMTAAGLLALWDTSGGLSAVIVSCYTALLSAAVIARGFGKRRAWQMLAGLLLLFADGAVRLVDSTLSFGQRGIFFLAVGMLLAAFSLLSFGIGRRKKRADRPETKEDAL